MTVDLRILPNISARRPTESPSGWFFWKLADDSDAVCVWCDKCKQLGTVLVHKIDRDGTMSPSLYCCREAHAFYVLENWPPNLIKPGGSLRVREIHENW